MARYDDAIDPDEVNIEGDLDLYQPYEPAGGGRHRRAAGEAGVDWGDDETGHSWAPYFHETAREPYGGASGVGEARPFGDQRHEYGRETSAAREDGQSYGRQERNYGHRRDSYYADDRAASWWELAPNEPERGPGQPPRPSFAGFGPRGYKRSDARIGEEVVERLADADWVDASDVEVEVSDGLVTLIGEVETRGERREAEQIAADVAAVVDVVNQLRVRDKRRWHRA